MIKFLPLALLAFMSVLMLWFGFVVLTDICDYYDVSQGWAIAIELAAVIGGLWHLYAQDSREGIGERV